MEIYVIQTWVRRRKSTADKKTLVLRYGNKNSKKSKNIASQISLIRIDRFPTESETQSGAELTSHLSVTREFNKTNLITVGASGSEEHYGALINTNTLKVDHNILKSKTGRWLGCSVHNLVCIDPYIFFVMDNGTAYLGKISNGKLEYEKVVDLTIPYFSNHCSLSIARYMTRDSSCFYTIAYLEVERKNPPELNICYIKKIDTRKIKELASPKVETIKLESKKDLVDICATSKYLIACSYTEVFKICKSTMLLLIKVDFQINSFSCLTSNDRFVYLSQNKSEIVLDIKSLKEIAKHESGLSSKRRLMDLFEYKIVSFLAILIDEKPSISIFLHCRNSFSLVYSLKLTDFKDSRVFHILWLPKKKNFILTNALSLSRVFHITIDNKK